MTRPICECRCDERLKTKAEESTRLAYTGLLVSGSGLFAAFLGFFYFSSLFFSSLSLKWLERRQS
jgi:hypothetical protein